MKLAALALLASLVCPVAFAQTGTFTTTGRDSTCPGTSPTNGTRCYINLSQNGGHVGLIDLVSYDPEYPQGYLYRWNGPGGETETGYALGVTYSVDTTNFIINFSVNNPNEPYAIVGSGTMEYEITPAHRVYTCGPHGCSWHTVPQTWGIIGGTATFSQ